MRHVGQILLGLLVSAMVPMPVSCAEEHKVSESPQAARFERLLKQRQNDPALHYNLGTVRYRDGHYDKAAESLSTAIASSSSSLQGRASYNFGNTHYRLGRAAEQATPNQAVDFYQKALEDYRLAIRQDPTDKDAKYNYELVGQRLKALKTQQAQQQSGKAQQQQANQQPSETQQANAQQTESEQTKQDQQQAQIQQQAGQSGESQQQQATSTESKSQPESTPSTETAQGTEHQQQGRQAQAVQQQPGQQGSEQQAQTATEPQNMSQQQALWILDNLKSEERGALVKEHRGSARETDVEQDW